MNQDRVLLDTSIWIEFYKPAGDPHVVEAVNLALLTDSIRVTGLVRVELCRGARTKEDRQQLQTDLDLLESLEINHAVYSKATDMAWTLERSGERIPIVDVLVASIALTYDVELWHYGDHHYERVAQIEALKARSFLPRPGK